MILRAIRRLTRPLHQPSADSLVPYAMFDQMRTEQEVQSARKMERIYHRGQDKVWDGKAVLAELVEKHGSSQTRLLWNFKLALSIPPAATYSPDPQTRSIKDGRLRFGCPSYGARWDPEAAPLRACTHLLQRRGRGKARVARSASPGV